MKLTTPRLIVLKALLHSLGEQEEIYASGLAKAIDMNSSLVSSTLSRFEEEGWLSSRWEKTPISPARSPRKYYRWTNKGRLAVTAPPLVERLERIELTIRLLEQ